MNGDKTFLAQVALVVYGMVLGAVLDMSPMEAVKTAAITLLCVSSALLPALGDDTDDETGWPL